MFHFVVFLISFIVITISFQHSFLSENMQISLSILGFIALFRFWIEKQVQYSAKLREKALELEQTDKDKTDIEIGKFIYIYEDELSGFPDFKDYLVKFTDGREMILSTSNTQVIRKILISEGQTLKIYRKENFIIDVEDFSNDAYPADNISK